MAEHECDRQEVFTPPPRPACMKTLNELGESLDLAGIVPLTHESPMQQAVANTGLSDFGAVGWLEPFTVLMRSIDSEAPLHLAGRILTRGKFLQDLEAKPKGQCGRHEYKKAPTNIIFRERPHYQALPELLWYSRRGLRATTARLFLRSFRRRLGVWFSPWMPRREWRVDAPI